MKFKSIFILMYLICIESNILGQSVIKVDIEKIGEGICKGPEAIAIAIDNAGYIYSGMEDGRIVRFNSDGSTPEVFAQTGGRPLGLKFDSEGNLLVCDAYKGLLSISLDGNISVLSTEHDGKPFKLTDDLDISIKGTVYFSDATYKYSLDNYWPDDYPHANGRLLAYDPITKTTSLILDSLYFANGVVMGPDHAFFLVAESWKKRVRRYWLTGSQQGKSDIFIDMLPGYPDNITFNGKDIFWLAIFNGSILGLDLLGNIKYILEYPVNSYSNLTSVIQYNDKLYLGSLTENFIGFIQLPDTITSINYIYQKNQIAFAIFHNYPNPFNSSTTIIYSIPEPAPAILKVYDLIGKEVQILVNEFVEAGTHSVNFDAGNLPSGMYIYKLQAGDLVETRKMLIMR